MSRGTPSSGPTRAATSVIPDDPVLYDDLSVWEHAEYVARLHAFVLAAESAGRHFRQLDI